jgi:hypothetical protein
MVWIKDESDKWVNIDSWDYLDYRTLEDKENNENPIVYEFIVSDRFTKEHTLGYKSIDVIEHAEEYCEKIIKGNAVYLETLESVLYEYLKNELNELYGEMSIGKDFEKQYNQRMEYINNIKYKRFS